MITPWLPGFDRVDLDLTGIEAPEVGRAYDETSHPKVCLHTTEGSGLAGAERAFAAYPPHIGVDPVRRIRHQYLPLDRCSFSLKGSENDDEFVVQVEVVGFAASTPGMSDADADWLGREVVGPIAKAIGAPLVAPPQGFKAPSDVPYALASSSSPLRFGSEAALRAFSGVMGHQHAPAPDSHWDPGGIRINRILAAARGVEDDMTPEQEAKLDRILAQLDTGHVGSFANRTIASLKRVENEHRRQVLAAVEGVRSTVVSLLAPFGTEWLSRSGVRGSQGAPGFKETTPLQRWVIESVSILRRLAPSTEEPADGVPPTPESPEPLPERPT